MSDLFAPEGGWRVRILDLSATADDRVVEEIGGFPTLMHANAFARRYVRDSVVVGDGLAQGDVVVTAGTQKLLPGQKVALMDASAAQ